MRISVITLLKRKKLFKYNTYSSEIFSPLPLCWTFYINIEIYMTYIKARAYELWCDNSLFLFLKRTKAALFSVSGYLGQTEDKAPFHFFFLVK
jgi:hypothetical protein